MDEYPYHLMVKEDEPACGARDDKALTYRVDVANCPACLRSSLRAAEERAEAAEHALAFNVLTVRAEVAERRAEGLEEAVWRLLSYHGHSNEDTDCPACSGAFAALARPRSEETPTSPDNANREE